MIYLGIFFKNNQKELLSMKAEIKVQADLENMKLN